MKHALHSAVFALLLASGLAVADDMPTFKVLMKDGRIHPKRWKCLPIRAFAWR